MTQFRKADHQGYQSSLSVVAENVDAILPAPPMATFSATVPTNAGPSNYRDPIPADLPRPYKHPSYVKERVVKQRNRELRREFRPRCPTIGLIAYVGSPVNGNMVIGNPEIVDDWLTYIKTAQERKVLNTREGMLKIEELNKLCEVDILPGARHEFNISYDLHPGMSCAEHKHDKRIWESAAYPSQIVSCQCLTTSND